VTAADDAKLVGTIATCEGATYAPALANAAHPIARAIAITTTPPDHLMCSFSGLRIAMPARLLHPTTPEPVRSAHPAVELAFHGTIRGSACTASPGTTRCRS